MLLRLITSAKIQLGLLRSRVEEDFGATAVEYALMLAFIAAVIVGAVAFLGRQTNSQFQKVSFNPAP
jgi:Flp pilus assembly pilin Flp